MNAEPWIETIRRGLISSRATTNEAIFSRVLQHAPRRVLDAGCGEGWLVRRLAKTGIDASGFDASPALVDAARREGLGRYFAATYQEVIAETSILGGPYDAAIFNFSLFDQDVVPILGAVQSRLMSSGRIMVQTLHPIIAAGDSYQDGWRVEHFLTMAHAEWTPMPWYFRTLGSWMRTFADAGLSLEDILEPRDEETKKVVSVIFELRRL